MSERSGETSPAAAGFIEDVIDSYQNLYGEIEEGERAEHDLMPRLVRNLFLDALGFDATDYEQENDWSDIQFYDNDRHPVIIVEGKRRDVGVEEGIDQAFRYASDKNYVKYLISTNVDKLLLFRTCDKDESTDSYHGVHAKQIAEIEFEGIINKMSGEGLADELSLDERQNIQQLMQIRKQEISDPDRYDTFDITKLGLDERQDVNTDKGFQNLIQTLSTCLDEYLMRYTLKAFDEFEKRYEEYTSQAEDIESQIERLKQQDHEDSEIAELEIELGNLKEEYAEYREFHSDFETWVALSNRQENEKKNNKEIFCRESVYVQINKILLIRIAEDQGLTNQMISNGGVTDYFAFWEDYTEYTDRDYADLFDVASEELSEVYNHLYSQKIFDWNLRNGEELNEVLKRTFWHLNRYDFSNVKRDVLGHLYEEHLDPQERKELGEFYTPTSVVDTILDQVGYTPDRHLEEEGFDILDPACGSGTFLVRAVTRLRKRLDRLGVSDKQKLDYIQNRIHGLDLNPFATHICEMNLLFQIIDLYRNVKEEEEDYTLNRFDVYQTDSLRDDTQINVSALQSNILQRRYQEEKKRAHDIKSKEDYRFVVGNPPYVRIQNLPEGPAREDYDEYDVTHYNYDLYCLFVERARDWLIEGGDLGFIVSNKFVTRRYGEKLQEYAPVWFHLNTVINFGSVDVFNDADTFPMIMIAERSASGPNREPDDFVLPEDYQFTYGEVSETFPWLIENGYLLAWDDVDDDADSDTPSIPHFLDSTLPDVPGETPPDIQGVLDSFEIDADMLEEMPINVYPVSSEMIVGGDWRFVSATEQEVMESIEAAGDRLLNFCEDGKIERGLRTSLNEAFIVDEDTIKEYDLDQDLTKPLLKGVDVERWYASWEDQYVIYTQNDTPIEEPDGDEEDDEYENTRAYLEEYKNIDDEDTPDLEGRSCVEAGTDPWYAIDKNKTPEHFTRRKIITPDLVLYNNFWLDDSEEYYPLNTNYYILPAEDVNEWYLLGVLNSDVVQFYYRRTAPTNKDDFLRYNSDYIQEIPVPNPEQTDSDIVNKIESLAQTLQNRVADYHHAEDIEKDPTLLLEDIDRDDLPLCTYIEALDLSSGDLGDPYRDGETIQLNVSDSIVCTSDDAAEMLLKLVSIIGFDSASDINEFKFPKTDGDLTAFVDEYKSAAGSLNDIEQEIIDLEDELNGTVYRAYGLSDENQEFIANNVQTPFTPVRPKAMSKAD